MTQRPVRVAIAGSTGSIGTQTFEVIRAENKRDPGSYGVTGISVGRSGDAALAQAAEFDIPLIVVDDAAARSEVGATGRVCVDAHPTARIDDAGSATLADTSALAVARDQEVAGDHGENHDKDEYEKEG